jgi:fluoroquinolone transport system permease protein
MNAIRALTITDLRNVLRDSFLKFMLIYPLFLGLVMRWLVPLFTEGLADMIDLTQYYPLLAALFGLILAPVLMGVAVGFLLLDERDARTLTALQVTPLTMTQYLSYRLLIPLTIGLVSSFVVLPLLNLMPLNILAMLPMVVVSAISGPIYTLLLAAVATNKVQGLAVMKGMGIFVIAPVAAWFVPEPAQYILGVIPTYWPVKALWVMMAGGTYWPHLLVGTLLQVLYLALLLRLFRRSMERLNG